MFAFTSSCSLVLLSDEFEDQRRGSWEGYSIMLGHLRLGCPCTKEDWTCVIVVPSWVVIRGWWVVDQRWAQKHWHTVPQHVWGLIHMLFGDTFSVNSGAGIKDNIVKWRLDRLLFVFSHLVYCRRCCRFQSCLAHVLRRAKDFPIIRLVWPATWLIAVAVVLSEGGNHAEEMRGGAAIIVTPLIPFRIAHAWQLHILSQFTHFLCQIY